MILDGQIGQPQGGGGDPAPASVLAPITVEVESGFELSVTVEDTAEITVEVIVL